MQTRTRLFGGYYGPTEASYERRMRYLTAAEWEEYYRRLGLRDARRQVVKAMTETNAIYNPWTDL